MDGRCSFKQITVALLNICVKRKYSYVFVPHNILPFDVGGRGHGGVNVRGHCGVATGDGLAQILTRLVIQGSKTRLLTIDKNKYGNPAIVFMYL